MNEGYEERIASGVDVERKNIVLGKAIKKKEGGDIVGYMLMTIEEEKILRIYKDLAQNMSAEMFVLDKNNIVISSAEGSAKVGNTYTDSGIIRRMGENRLFSSNG